MSARILVVDDILPNVKLLEAKLTAEYFNVITALNGPDGIEKAETMSPDIILLDVMMPGMDGFEVCRRLKASPITSHIPVVMVTALTDATERVQGLEAGADDFLSKPVNDVALMSRVRSLVRLKMTIDEWRARENTASQLGFGNKAIMQSEAFDKARMLVIEDKDFESEKIIETLRRDEDIVTAVRNGEQGLAQAQQNQFDIIVLSLNLVSEDGLRLVAHLHSNERTRGIPILVIGEETDPKKLATALELGAHDYIMRPVDRNELLARVHTQVRRKRYQDRLRANYEASLEAALIDSLTGVYNRRYLMVHLDKLFKRKADAKKNLTILMLDIDKFKSVNDTYGHNVGDEVLKTFADRIALRLRSFDTVARMGGEEFVAILPDVGFDMAVQIAERLRKCICDEPFKVSAPEGQISVSVSIGAIMVEAGAMEMDEALRLADEELYNAKENGRNRTYFHGHGHVTVLEKPPEDVAAETPAETIRKSI